MLTYLLTYLLTYVITYWLTNWLTDWLTDWLIYLLTYLLAYLLTYFSNAVSRHFCVYTDISITPQQQEAFNYYKKNTMSIEILKDDHLQKVNFRVKNKARLDSL